MPQIPAKQARISALILVMFFGSGCAALIYEVIWLHLLRLVIGASTTSLGILLACFMGGMSIGSYLLPRLVSPKRHPFRVYAVIEVLIGVIGLALVYLSTMTHEVYAWLGDHQLAGTWAKVLIAVGCLLPPTILMGATLPVIARWVKADTKGAARLGFYYGANIIGAVCGCLLVGFILLQYFDVLVATYVAASLNILIALVAWVMSFKIAPPGASESTDEAVAESDTPASEQPAPAYQGGGRLPTILACVVAGLSGCSALGAEVVWTRLLSLILGGTVYTFAIILAVFLAGLGIGGGIGSMIVGRTRRPMMALGVCQFLALLAVAHASTHFNLIHGLTPDWWKTVTANLPSRAEDVLRCIWVVAPAAVCWGASFPLAIAIVIKPGRDTGKSVGVLGAINTFGAILGALMVTFWTVPAFGTQKTQIIIVSLSMVSAALALGYGTIDWVRSTRSSWSWRPWYRYPGLQLAVVSVIVVVFCVHALWRIPPVSDALLAHGKHRTNYINVGKVLFSSEGVHSPVVVKRQNAANNHTLTSLHISGKLVASNELVEMRLERMLGHIPQVLHDNPRSVLIIGLGAGVTAGTFVVDPRVEKITICEIEPRVYDAAKGFFAEENKHVLDDPRTTVVYDDARHYLAVTDEKFDIIASDPIHPWVRGAATLYSQEFYEQCHDRLNPGGVVAHWLPLNSMSTAAVKSETATFFNAFPRATIWHTGDFVNQRHLIICGSIDPKPIDLDRAYALIEGTPAFKQSLEELKLSSTAELLALYTSCKPDLSPWLADAQINRDWAMRLEYLAGKAYHRLYAHNIYDQILEYHIFPEALYQGSDELIQDLRERFDAPVEMVDLYGELEAAESQQN